MLHLKNIKTGDTWDIPAEGMTMGRAGAKAEIQIADPGVSKRHARIFQQNGGWFLEDVGSSNGTYIQGKRLTEPVALNEGLVFGMSRNKFQVVTIAGAANGNGHHGGGSVEDEMLFDQDLPPPDVGPPPGGPPLPPPGPDPYAPPQSAPPQYAPPQNGAQTAPPQTAPPQYQQQPQGQQQVPAPVPGGDEVPALTVGYVMAAVPKAVGFYIARVPLMIFNPLGTIRKSYEEQPVHPMGKFELMVYAFPAYLFTMAVGTIAGFIALAINGVFTIPIVPLIINVVSAAVASLIVGFFGHGILGWFVRILKGESDARSRTNFYLMFFTATILVAIPNGVATVLGSVRIPFVICISPLLLLVGSVLMLTVMYKWYKYFGVHKAIPIIILVLLALTALGGVANFGSSVWTSIQWIMGDGPGDIPGVPGIPGTPDTPSVSDFDPDDFEIPDSVPKEARAGLEASLKTIKEMKAQGVTGATYDAAVQGLQTSVAAFGGKPVPTPATPKTPDAPKLPDVVVPKTPPPPKAPDMAYSAFSSKLRKVESKISGNPALLKGKVRTLYGKLSAIEYGAETRFNKAVEDKPELRKVFERDRQSEIWSQGATTVGELYDELGLK